MSASSTENHKNFEERLQRIDGAHRKSGRISRSGSGEYFRKDAERRKRGKKGKRGNWTARILLVVAAFLGVKTYIIFDMGPEAYDARMAELSAGGNYEKAAAMALQPDPVTGKIQEILINAGVMEPKPASASNTPQVLTAGVAGAGVAVDTVETVDAATIAAEDTVTTENADTTVAAPASE